MKIVCELDDGTEYEYQITPASSFTQNQKKPSTKMPMPFSKAEEGLLMRYKGQEKDYSIQFDILNNGEDRANGTAPQDGTFTDTDGDGTEDVITIEEQKQWLEDYIDETAQGTTWYFTHGTIDNKEVLLEDISFDESAEDPKIIEVSIDLTVGKVMT